MDRSRSFWLCATLSLVAWAPSAITSEPIPGPDHPFTIGPAQFVAEKDSPDSYTIVVPVQVKKPEQLKAGLRVAYVVFDQAITEPPRDLKSDEATIVLNPGKGGQHQMNWSMRTVNGDISGKASFIMGPPQQHTKGNQAVFRYSWHGLPDKDMGLFLFGERMQPCSNVLVFRKADFAEGNGDVCFKKAVSELSASDHSSGTSE